MTVNVTWPQRDQIQAIAEAVGAAVEDGGAAYFPQLDGVSARAVLIDGPGIGQTDPGLKDRLDLPLRLFVALIAGAVAKYLLLSAAVLYIINLPGPVSIALRVPQLFTALGGGLVALLILEGLAAAGVISREQWPGLRPRLGR
jgi:hypothetical protein